jgi:hypothetical protein
MSISKEVKKDFRKFEEEIEEEFEEIEGWIKERRKFFIKLIITFGIIFVLWILSYVFLRVPGVGF